MKWFFEDADAARKLRNECESWRGTPFAYFSRAKGPHGGIDCLGFVEEVTAAVGLESWTFERTNEDYSRHVHNDKILKHLRGQVDDPASATLFARWAEFMVVEEHFTEQPMTGDLLILKDAGGRGNGVFHMPIMINGSIFMHCAPPIGVLEGQIDDPTYRTRLYAHFRARATPEK